MYFWSCLFCGSSGYSDEGFLEARCVDLYICDNCPYLGPEHPEAWVTPERRMPIGFDAIMQKVHPHRERPEEMHARIMEERSMRNGSISTARLGNGLTAARSGDVAYRCEGM